MEIRDIIPSGKWRFGILSLRENGNSGYYLFEKMKIRDIIPSGKWDSGFGFGKLGFGIISLREIRYFGQMSYSGNLLFGIMASGKDTFGNYGFGKSSDIAFLCICTFKLLSLLIMIISNHHSIFILKS